MLSSGGTGGITAQVQIYTGAPICVVKIIFANEIAAL